MKYISKWFADSEFFCKDGCGLSREDVDDSIVSFLDLLADTFKNEMAALFGKKPEDFPIAIHSSCRCSKHNKDVGGARNSYHLAIKGRQKALAIDSAPKDLSLLKYWRRISDKLNKDGGVGFYRSFIHNDRRGHRARWRA